MIFPTDFVHCFHTIRLFFCHDAEDSLHSKTIKYNICSERKLYKFQLLAECSLWNIIAIMLRHFRIVQESISGLLILGQATDWNSAGAREHMKCVVNSDKRDIKCTLIYRHYYCLNHCAFCGWFHDGKNDFCLTIIVWQICFWIKEQN